MSSLPAFADALLALFVEHLDHGPEQTVPYQKLSSANQSNDAFNEWRGFLAKYRIVLAGVRAQLPRDQVVQCLSIVRQGADPAIRELLARFSIAALGPGWSDEQRKYFGRLAPILASGHDYFLSFTGRSPGQPVGVVLRVNREYDAFIAWVFTPERRASADRSEENLLAAAIDALLTERGLRGFFYPQRRGDSAEVLKKLEEGCRSSLCFIQLLANEMLMPLPPGEKNYCYWEYDLATTLKLPQLFLFPYENKNQLLPKLQADVDLWTWYDQVNAIDLRVLPTVRYTNEARLTEITEKIDATVEQIVASRMEAIAAVPE